MDKQMNMMQSLMDKMKELEKEIVNMKKENIEHERSEIPKEEEDINGDIDHTIYDVSSKDQNCPKRTILDRLVGSSNETTIQIEGVTSKALIDSGSMVSSISKTFYDKLPSKPVLHSLEDFELEVKTANGTLVNYLGYIEATIESKTFSHGSVTTLFLVVPTTEYHHNVPVLIGTNVIRELKENNIESEDTPDVWKSALMSVGSASVGIVTSTQPVTLKPMESRTISGFVRKTRNVDAAVTEPIEDNFQQKSIVCPRVVQLTNSGKTARVPVRICNISAKILKLPARSEICQLNEVKVIRHADIGSNTSVSEKENESNISENFLPDLKDHPVSHQQST
ncbi:uncharacterized protein LOC128553268 [Mercenaria mercenaria]|uniref:uncharacterized protein LOC128553268 n=1 Tax=Mercenaria mercenaria TaxID=6596 RepID=UPI00234ED7A5|nr:uncharacterized protein LOC128553268 [Mercenaria mercenaria]